MEKSVFDVTMDEVNGNNCANVGLVRELLRHAKNLGLKPRFTNFVSMQDRCFPFEPMFQKENTEDSKRESLERLIVDSMLTALVCSDVRIAFRAFYIGMQEVGELKGSKLGTKVVPLATITDMEYAARERLEKILFRG